MATAQVGNLQVRVGADITGLKTGMAQAQRQVRQSATVMQRSVTGISSSFKSLAATAGIAFGAAGLAVGARAFLRVADAAKQMQAQLKLATAEFGSLAQANKDVRGIAERTRSDLLATSELYAALQRNSGQLGTTQQEVARATETVAKAFKVSGAATSEQSAATRQLIQAFQSGVLRGDEFNSIMENAPRLARLLADSLGVTVGQLRAMAKEGKLTADALVRAFTDQRFTEGLDEEFKQLPVTFDEAMNQLYNAAVVTFGAFDQGGQFSTMIANFASGGATDLASLENRSHQFGVEVRAVMDGISAAMSDARKNGVGAFDDLIDWSFSFADALRVVLGTLDGVQNALTNLFQAPANIGRWLAGQPLVTGQSDRLGAYDRASAESRREASRRRIMGRSLNDVLAEAGMGRTPPPFVAPPGKEKKKRAKRPPRDRSADVEYQFENEIRQARQDILRAQQALARTAEERARIELQLLDLDKEQHNAELDERVRKAQRDFAEKKITASTLQEVTAQAEILRKKYDEVDGLRREAVSRELRQEKYEDAARLADVSLDIQQEQLQAESQLAETAAEQRDIQLRILDLAYRQERARLETVLADEASSEAAKEEARRRLAAIDARYDADRRGVVASTRGPLEDYIASLPTTAAKAREALEELQVRGVEGLIDSVLELRNGFKAMGDMFKRVIDDMVMALLRSKLQQLLGSLLQGGFSLGSILGGSKGVISEAGAVGNWVGPRATGGPVVPGRTYRVGENGPELIRVGARGQVVPNSEIGGIVKIVPSPYFDVVVDGRVVKTAGPMMGHAAIAGAAGGVQGIQRRASRQLP